jgi:WD40 repeat protein
MNKKLLQLIISLGLVAFILIGCASQTTSRQITIKNANNLVELRTIQGPTDGIASLALNSDGSILAYGNYGDNAVHLVKVDSGEEIKVLEGHTAAVSNLVFSPDGRLLASTGTVNLSPKDGSVRIWDVASGQQLATFATSGTSQLVFSPDGLMLAGAGGGDPVQIRIWDAKNFSEKEAVKNVFSSVAFSPDGKSMAAGSRDKSLHVLDVATGKEVKALVGHDEWVTSTAFSPQGGLLASGSSDKTIHLWDASTGKKLKSLTGHLSGVDFLVFSPDGSVLASLGSGVNVTTNGSQFSISISSEDKIVRFWDTKTGEQIGSIKTSEGASCASVNSNWTFVATGDEKGVIQIWGMKP